MNCQALPCCGHLHQQLSYIFDEHRQIYTLDEVDGGTRITLDVEHRLKGFVSKLMSPFIGWHLKSEHAKEMERLRRALEKL